MNTLFTMPLKDKYLTLREAIIEAESKRDYAQAGILLDIYYPVCDEILEKLLQQNPNLLKSLK